MNKTLKNSTITEFKTAFNQGMIEAETLTSNIFGYEKNRGIKLIKSTQTNCLIFQSRHFLRVYENSKVKFEHAPLTSMNSKINNLI